MPASATPSRSRVGPRGGALIAVAAALAVCAPGMTRASLWFDEAAAISGADRPLSEIWRLVHTWDAVHALYYALLHGWMRLFGDSVLSLRALPLVGFCLAAAGLAVFANRSGRGLLFWATAVGALILLPRVALSATQTRGDVFALASAMWAFVLLQTIMAQPDDPSGRDRTVCQFRLWAGYGLLVVLGAHFGLLSLLGVPAQLLYVGLSGWRLRPMFVTVAVATVACLPLVITGWQQRSQVAWIGDYSTMQVLGQAAVAELFAAQSLRGFLLITSALAGAVFYAVVLIALIAERTADWRFFWYTLVWYAFPTVLLVGLTLTIFPIYQPRYLIAMAPGACLLFAAGVTWLMERVRWGAVLALLVIAALLAPGHVAMRWQSARAGEDYLALAALGRGADQVVYIVPESRGIGLAYPGLLSSASDVLLADSPVAAGNLWGTNRPLDWWAPAGRVVVYAGGLTRAEDNGEIKGLPSEAASRLAEARCLPTGQYQGGTRFQAAVFSCPA